MKQLFCQTMIHNIELKSVTDRNWNFGQGWDLREKMKMLWNKQFGTPQKNRY